MKVINLSEKNSVLSHFLKEMRSVSIQKDSMRFRYNVQRIGELMAYEISKTLRYEQREVQTFFDKMLMPMVQDKIVLGSILRAALPFHSGFLNIFDSAENAFISAYRQYGRSKKGEQEIEIVREYLATPSLADKTLILTDPMLATGMSMEVAYQAMVEKAGVPKTLHLACIIASQAGVKYAKKTLPEKSTLWCVAIDPTLNDQKFIVPGLGDAGDLCFGEKMK